MATVSVYSSHHKGKMNKEKKKWTAGRHRQKKIKHINECKLPQITNN